MLRNITLSADESLIKKAREKAMKEKRTLNIAFREWLALYTRGKNKMMEYHNLMQRLSYANAGKRFSRDELNER